MSDSSCCIECKIKLYGKEEEFEWFINYYPDSCYYGVDQRILDFFKNFYEEARKDYDNEIEEMRNKEIEAEERAELARLKEKYES